LNAGKGKILLIIGWVAWIKTEKGIFLIEDDIFGEMNNPSLFPSYPIKKI
jgi:hypothetical protein